MLSNKVIEYLKQQGIYTEQEDDKYKESLIDLGIDLNSDFAMFNLNIHFEGNVAKCMRVDSFTIVKREKFSILNWERN